MPPAGGDGCQHNNQSRSEAMKKLFTVAASTALLALSIVSPAALAEKKSEFSICWSIYVGWVPWDYGEQEGVVKKWADKYGISIDVVQINDYVESINQYTAGQFDGCTMTNMDALTIPAAGGVDSTALIVGDFSNGNDAVILKGEDELAAIEGQTVNLVELSVSHYLLARGLESVGLSERDVTVTNTSDADMVSAYTTDDVTAVVTWNPLVSEILSMPGSNKVFDSAQIPGEIIDLMIVNTETLAANPEFGKALTGAWYEIMGTLGALPNSGLAARVSVFTIIRSMISPGICAESKTLLLPGIDRISLTSGFQVTTAVT